MAVTYRFNCSNCDSKAEIYLGQSKIECKNREPTTLLGSCTACKKLFGTKLRQCTYCLRTETPYFTIFKNLKISFPNNDARKFPLNFYEEDEVKKVSCPKCNHKYLTATPRLFHD